MPQIFTANRLTDGLVVYLTTTGDWSEHIGQSFVCTDKDELRATQDRAEQAAMADKVVEPYAIDVERNEGGLRPVRYREVIRAFGPSIEFASGEQAPQDQITGEQTNVSV